ncbi:MAG: GGDEF domain-containing protein [Gaiellaceae bacterium]
MSALPTDIPLQSPIEEEDNVPLPPAARVYLFLSLAAALAVTLPFAGRLSQTDQWTNFAILGVATALAQLFVVRTSSTQSYHTTIVFLVPAVLLLPPELLGLIAVVQHIPEWLKERYRWRTQAFNIANFTIGIMAARGLGHLVVQSTVIGNRELRLAVAGMLVCLAIVSVNHVMLAVMLRLAHGTTMRDSGLLSVENLSTDLVLAALGVGVTFFWNANPWLIPFAVAPLVLIHRSLSVPALQAEARVDPKTGLFNARHFASALAEELGRAERFQRPMSLIMADLDLLRDINNTYGHLAGDAVLQGIAEVFRQQLRHYDVPARFGGEEFSILLPETPPEQAMEIAERIRRAVAERLFDVETSSEPIRATISIGIAGYPKDGTDANELIHQADLAVYRAKLQGRNRVLGASSEPLLVPTDRSSRLVAVPEEGEHHTLLPAAAELKPAKERRHPRPHAVDGPRFLSLSPRLATLVGVISVIGAGAGLLGVLLGSSHDYLG